MSLAYYAFEIDGPLMSAREPDSNYRVEITSEVKDHEVFGKAARIREVYTYTYTSLETGEKTVLEKTGHSYQAAPGVNTDICPYCGADNGKDGSGRDGWNCYVCGGN